MAPDPTTSAIESALSNLQPIRDLSLNWDIDIASCLEEYLHELVGIQPAVAEAIQNGESAGLESSEVPNFAQAALLLQNSSNVYSRKVEYLYSLVYKALEEFFTSGSPGAQHNARKKTQDAAVEEFHEFDPNVEFLLLDDVIPQDAGTAKINMKHNLEPDIDEIGTPNRSLSRIRLSLGSVGALEKTTLSRASTGGTAVSTQHRAVLNSLSQGSLRLAEGNCDIGDDGLLMLPGSAPNIFNDFQDLKSEHRRRRSSISNGEGLRDGEFVSSEGAFGGAAALMDTDMGGDDYDDDDGPGFVFANDDDHVDNGVENAMVATEEPNDTKRVTFAEPKVVKTKPDPWAMMDPHDSSTAKPKPLRKGKTFKLPSHLDAPPSEYVNGSSTQKIPVTPEQENVDAPKKPSCLALEALEIMSKLEASEDVEIPVMKLNRLHFGTEFEYILRATQKKKAAERRAQRKLEVEGDFADEQAAAVVEEDDEGDYAGGYAYGADDDSVDEEGDDVGGNLGITSLDDAYTGTNMGTKTFEELCREHIQAFAKGAEDYALSTQLSERVNKWQEKLAPILEEEELRGQFDIHEYSERVIQSVQNELQRGKRKSDGTIEKSDSAVDFASVTRHCDKHDVCRIFLASLSLANTGNIKIVENDFTEGSYRFELLSASINRPMESFLAPSLLVEGGVE